MSIHVDSGVSLNLGKVVGVFFVVWEIHSGGDMRWKVDDSGFNGDWKDRDI